MDLDLISNTVLFRGCPKEDIEAMARHLNFRTNQYKKGNVVFHSGEIITDAGLVLSGTIQIEHTDLWGNKSILGITDAGGVFGEAYACIPSQPLLIDVTANTDCRILLISIPGLFSPCPVCQSQRQVIQNLLIISAQKNLRLSERSLDTSPKTIRGRLLSYFSRQISLQGTSTVTIPFDRQQLADYLNLDRSALSKELGKMKREHLIQYHKNVFQINIHAIKAT
ncbi:MAG: Crp/Fnr family transcriptional regulator [Hungatella sp.]|nr:Crp/Fnr family transcriptional regulator [Hungatella sp.]